MSIAHVQNVLGEVDALVLEQLLRLCAQGAVEFGALQFDADGGSSVFLSDGGVLRRWGGSDGAGILRGCRGGLFFAGCFNAVDAHFSMPQAATTGTAVEAVRRQTVFRYVLGHFFVGPVGDEQHAKALVAERGLAGF